MPRTVPTSTYRLQITGSFTLADAAALTDYLRDLGVGAVYCLPCCSRRSAPTTATTPPTRPRSTPTAAATRAATLLGAPRGAGLGVVVDIVPNHLGIAEPAENPALWDVLRLGQDSPYAAWFDIDWSRRAGSCCRCSATTPTLSVEDGELRYYDHRFPLAPGTWHEGDDPDEVHARQHYELAHWRRANTELNYRRFFAVTTLAGVRSGGPGGLRRHPRAGRHPAGRRRDGAAGGPPRRPGRPGRLPRAPARPGPGRLDHRREDPRAGRGAAADGRSRAPPATTRCARSTACSSTTPRRPTSPSSTGG